MQRFDRSEARRLREQEGLTFPKIAAHFDVSAEAVRKAIGPGRLPPKARVRVRGTDADRRRRVTDDQVNEIRRRYAADPCTKRRTGGVRQVDLASEYGISQSRLSAIVRGAERSGRAG